MFTDIIAIAIRMVGVICFLAGYVSLVATAQLSVQGDDFSPDLGLGTGMVFTEDETYEDLPKRPRTRGVVMYDRIDLSRFFPPPGPLARCLGVSWRRDQAPQPTPFRHN